MISISMQHFLLFVVAVQFAVILYVLHDNHAGENAVGVSLKESTQSNMVRSDKTLPWVQTSLRDKRAKLNVDTDHAQLLGAPPLALGSRKTSTKAPVLRESKVGSKATALVTVLGKRDVPAKLMDEWPQKTRDNVRAQGKVSFQMFLIQDFAGTEFANKGGFWYSVEDTLHSAMYITQNEQPHVSWWVRALTRLQDQQKHNPSDPDKPVYCLDVGSNGGFYSLLSRSLGCSVLAVDGQPWCLTRLSSSAAMNGFTTNFQTVNTAVSDQKDLTIDVGSNKCSGLWAVRGSGWINRESTSIVTVASTPLLQLVDRWIQEDDIIGMFKIDVEGSEMSVILSALPLFRSGRILNVLVEITPALTEKILPWKGVGGDGRGIEYVLETLYASNYTFTSSVTGGTDGHAGISLKEMKAFMEPEPPPEVLASDLTARPRMKRRRGSPDLYRIYRTY